MKPNKEIDLEKHPSTLKDAFWYWVVGVLGDVQAIIIERKVREPVWRSFDGRVTTPKMMGDRHLEKTVAMCQRDFADGEPYPVQYPALLKELHERRRLQSIRAQRLRTEQAAKDAEFNSRRAAQLEVVSSERFERGSEESLRTGWEAMHLPGADIRVYEHLTGAKVSLGKFGNWLWWRAGKHHYSCATPRETLESAMAAARDRETFDPLDDELRFRRRAEDPLDTDEN